MHKDRQIFFGFFRKFFHWKFVFLCNLKYFIHGKDTFAYFYLNDRIAIACISEIDESMVMLCFELCSDRFRSGIFAASQPLQELKHRMVWQTPPLKFFLRFLKFRTSWICDLLNSRNAISRATCKINYLVKKSWSLYFWVFYRKSED